MKKPTLLFFFLLLQATLVLSSLPLPLISLLSIKTALIDPTGSLNDWNTNPNPNSPSTKPPWCSWSGITCNPKTTHVISLDLSKKNLAGFIPPEIRFLTHLQHLNLSNNQFSGTFQTAIFSLPNLKTIDISHNNFNTTFPPGISNLPFLQSFNAYSNSFTGPLPLDITQLEFLEILNLGGSFFNGSVPASYGGFPRLRFLHLAGNLLEGSIPEQLRYLHYLEHLEIGYNNYHGGIPAEFGLFPNLRYLDISQSNLTGFLPPELGNLTQLESLFLFNNQFSGTIPASLSKLEVLKVLDLSNSCFSGKIPSGFSSLKELTLLGLMSNNLSGEIPSELAELPNLETLLLWNNSLTGNLPSNLGSNMKLVKLDVSSNFLTGPLPESLCYGNKLARLILFSNSFNSQLPATLTKCTSLWRFRGEGNSFSGPIPPGFGFLPNLTYMDLSTNNLSGNIPEDLSKAPRLELLNISENPLGVTLPETIWTAPSLQIFSASSCELQGKIPDFASCKKLYRLELGGNFLNGSIPWDIENCEKLVNLKLSRNHLTGIIPFELSTLPSISDIDLSYNSLTGTIPSSFDNCSTLESFNVSFNLLTGPVPSSGPVFKNLHPSSFSGNDGLCGYFIGKPCVSDSGELSLPKQQQKKSSGALVWVMAGVLGIGLFALIAGSRFLYRNYISENRSFTEVREGPWKLTAFQRLNFTVETVLECLSVSDTIIGMGSTGTVYRAEIPNGEVIAVKKLWGKQKETVRRRRGVLAEVEVLGNVRHRNIVRLLGCCSNNVNTLLLYEYMPNGSLHDLLHEKKKETNLSADWLTRYKIAVGVAQGICYLHHDCDPVIIHRDLKPSNILLDCEMEARVADFGVAKLIEADEETMSVIAGSYGYIAPEYAYTLQVDEKSDIYSFGVVLMEILSGKRSVDSEFGEGNNIVDWVRSKIKSKEGVLEVLDKNAGSACASVREEMMLVLRVALLCTSRCPADRPSMRDVVSMLQEAKPKRKMQGSDNGGGNPLGLKAMNC